MNDDDRGKNAGGIAETMRNALRDFEAGRLEAAGSACMEILSVRPGDPSALYLMGLVCYHQRRLDLSIDYLLKAGALDPGNADLHYNLGNALHDGGRLEEAAASYRKAIAINPENADYFNNLGIVLASRGRLDEAITSYQQAISLNPRSGLIFNNLGNAFRDKGSYESAVRCYREAIGILPDSAEVHKNIGNVYVDMGELDKALDWYREALKRDSADAEIYYNMANAYRDRGEAETAAGYYRKSLELDARLVDAHYNLGNALRDLGRYDDAIAGYENALALKPQYFEAFNNMGVVFKEKGELEESIRYYEKALAIHPDVAETQWNLALVYLLAGRFEEGWKRYEWRWKKGDYSPYKRSFPRPQWQGEEIAGKRVYLHAEQGYGDAIQFVRYAAPVAERGAEVIVEVPASLAGLFLSAEGVSRVVVRGGEIPEFDYHCPLLTLPMVFGTSLDTVPSRVPYLFSDPGLTNAWRQRLAEHGDGLRVGLVWSGNPEHKNDRNRSLPFEQLMPLMQEQRTLFFSLQKGRESEDPVKWRERVRIIDYTEELRDFADTAALIMNLDLVVSVDTAVAHLAGALGREVWTLLPYAPDWRWMLKRTDSPWYPSMRLIRQPVPGDWGAVIGQVRSSIRGMRRS